LGLIVIVGLLILPYTPDAARRTLSMIDLSATLASPMEAEAALKGGISVVAPEIRAIITQPTLSRQIPSIRSAGDHRAYEFFVSRPPLATQLGRRLHPPLERYTVTQVGEDVYTVEDRGVLRGEARLIAATGDQRIYWFQGEFRSLANLLHFSGRMVLVMRYREIREGDRTIVESDPQLYVRVDNPFFHVMSKLLLPLITSLIDRRVNMIVEASNKLFDQAWTDPKGLYQRMATWVEVQPADLEAYRQTFIERESVTR
jgi:hypothetical protein